MALDRVWFWRLILVCLLGCAVTSLPNLPETLDQWGQHPRSDNLSHGGEVEDENLPEFDDTSDSDDGQGDTQEGTQEQTDSSTTDDSSGQDPAADQESEDESDSAPESASGEQSKESEGDGALADDQEMESESSPDQSVADSAVNPDFVMPATRVVLLSLTALLAVGMLGSVLTTIAVSEAGRTSLMLAVIGPVLALSQRGESGTFTRGRILGYVEAHPGIHFSALRDSLDLANGVTAHHLRVLEKQGRIISWLDGSKRRFASSGIDPKLLSKLEHPVSGMQQAILEILSEAGNLGIKTGELRNRLETSRQLMSYHMKQLTDRGFVEPEGKGKARRWRLLEAGKAVLLSSQHL